MKFLAKAIADDGTEFLDADKCIAYESLCKKIDKIMALLVPIPDSCEFANGSGYIQQDPLTVDAARLAIVKYANDIFPHKWFEHELSGQKADSSWCGRLISDMSEKCLYKAWQRFMCMSSDYREYGQPYFASHQSEAKDVCLNQLG
jgi:hypothetical protein